MRRALVLIAVTASCRYDLDHAERNDAPQARPCAPSSSAQSCLVAETHSDFAYIHSTIFKPKCTFSGCHNGGATAAGSLDLRTVDAAHTHLVGVPSKLDAARMLVVPGNPRQSFALAMLGSYHLSEAEPPLAAIPTDERGRIIGTMPQDSAILCCQKLDAIERWITAGAAND